MYYTIYKITNQIDGKFYIGSHKTLDLNDTYMGSGKYLIRAQEKYGMENFKKEILFVFDSAEEMYAKEAEIVNADFLVEENTYNLKIGGFGGWDYINGDEISRILKNKKARTIADERIREIYGVDHISHLPEVREIISKKLKKRWDKGLMSPPPSFKGKHHSIETRKRIADANSVHQKGSKNSQFGTMWVTNGTENKKIKKTDTIPEGWYKGRV
jgi:hypothetical protein